MSEHISALHVSKQEVVQAIFGRGAASVHTKNDQETNAPQKEEVTAVNSV